MVLWLISKREKYKNTSGGKTSENGGDSRASLRAGYKSCWRRKSAHLIVLKFAKLSVDRERLGQ